MLPPDTFHDIPECFRLTFSSTAPHVYCWNCSLVKYMGCKMPAEQPQSSPEKDKEEDKEEKNILFDTVMTLDKQLMMATCCASPIHCLSPLFGPQQPMHDVCTRCSLCAVSGKPESEPEPEGERCCRFNSTTFSGSSNLRATRSARLLNASPSPPIACHVQVGRVVPTCHAVVTSMCAKLQQ
jgi:hypothetical protein